MPLRMQYYKDELRHRRDGVAYHVGRLLRRDNDPWTQPVQVRSDRLHRGGRVLLLGVAGVVVIAGFVLLTPSRVLETVDVAAVSPIGADPDADGAADASSSASLADDAASDATAEAALTSDAPATRTVSSRPSTWSPTEAVDDLPSTWVLPVPDADERGAERLHARYAAWDFETEVGTDVVAMTAALVTETSPDMGTCGGLVRLAAVDRGIELLYCHLSSVDVATGDIVRAGDLIGRSGGEPGTDGAGSSDGEHLHLELRVNGELRCPQVLMARLVGSGDGQLSDLEADVAGLARWECIIPEATEASPDHLSSPVPLGHATPSRNSGADLSCGESLGFRRPCD